MQDFVARGARARRLGADFRWPGGRHVAVVFNLAFEAWSDGVPVAFSNATALLEQVGEAALLFDPNDVAAIAEAVRRLATDERLRQDLKARGKSRAGDFDETGLAECRREAHVARHACPDPLAFGWVERIALDDCRTLAGGECHNPAQQDRHRPATHRIGPCRLPDRCPRRARRSSARRDWPPSSARSPVAL